MNKISYLLKFPFLIFDMLTDMVWFNFCYFLPYIISSILLYYSIYWGTIIMGHLPSILNWIFAIFSFASVFILVKKLHTKISDLLYDIFFSYQQNEIILERKDVID